MFFLSVFGFTDFYDNCPTCPAAGATITISSLNYNNDYSAGSRFTCIYELTVPTGHKITATLAAEANVNSNKVPSVTPSGKGVFKGLPKIKIKKISLNIHMQ